MSTMVIYRKVVLALLGIQAIGTTLMVIGLLATGSAHDATLGTTLVAISYSALLVAYWRGWQPARYLAIVLATSATILVLPEPYLTQEVSYTLLVAPIQALILGNAAWVLGSAGTTYIGILVKAGGQGIYTDPVTVTLFTLIIGGISLSHMLTVTAQRAAEANARGAEASARRAEDLTHEATRKAEALREKSAELQQRTEEQQRLLDLVTTLETPAITLADGILMTSIVGYLDSRRAEAITERLLYAAKDQQSDIVIIDLAGVATVDTQVARALLNTAQALHLLGCHVAVTGISSAIASTMTNLDMHLLYVETARSPQEILAKYGAFQVTHANGTATG